MDTYREKAEAALDAVMAINDRIRLSNDHVEQLNRGRTILREIDGLS